MNKRILYIFGVALILLNVYSLVKKGDFFQKLITIDNKKYKILDTILINEVYSNSFGYISKTKVALDTLHLYKLEKVDDATTYYLKLKIIKHLDSLYFLQKIKWITKQKRKISKGKYKLFKNE